MSSFFHGSNLTFLSCSEHSELDFPCFSQDGVFSDRVHMVIVVVVFVPMQNVQRGILSYSANMMDMLVIFRTQSKDLKNFWYTISITFIVLESTQTSHA
jgi:hypothetical protein